MKSRYKKIISVIVGLLLVVGTLAYLNGWFSGSKDAHPPCDQLPTVEKATEELANHEELAEEVKALGEDITIEVGKPCSDDSNRGLIQIGYGSKSEHDAISELMTDRDGFGAPVYLVKH